MLKYALTTIALLLSVWTMSVAQPIKVDSSVYHELQRRLAEAPNSADSLDIAINLFDLNFNEQTGRYGEMAYRLALEQGEMAKAMSMIKLLSSIYQNDLEKLDDLKRRAETLPNSNDKKELLTYLSLRKSYYEAYDLSSGKRNERMKDLAKVYLNSPAANDDYENIHRLFELCIYLHAIFEQSAMLSNYYDKLGTLIEHLPAHQTSLRNLYYSMASVSYSRQFLPEKAVENDLRLLEHLKELRNIYLLQGRRYRTLDTNLFTIYTRILSNYEALTPDEVRSYYMAIKEIAARNSKIADIMEHSERPQIYYFMATRQYDKALPLLKKHIDELANRKNAIYFNRAMMTAADAMGDNEAYKKAASLYMELLEEYIRDRTAHNLAELAITYDLNQAKSDAEKLRDQQKEASARTDRTLLALALAAVVLLLILMLVFMYQWRRKRKASLELKAAVDELKQERDNLQRVQSDLIMARDQTKAADRQKADFIHMISHQVKTPLQAIAEYTGLIVDCMDAEKKKYLGRFAEVVQLNTELINSMINDITEVSALEANEVEVRIQPASLHDICAMAADSIRPTLNEKQNIVLETEEDYTIATDRRRLEQIVTNLLENAVKFSDHGSIRVAYKVDQERNRVDISISDQGIGIPTAKQEVIFDRFVKLDNNMPGMGLGLYVTRLLTRLMGGEVHVDRGYKGGGARFVVSLRAKSL